jgi:hypothetical protein
MATKPKPYFKGQEPCMCGCYYPDVMRVGDVPKLKIRLLHCVRHGYLVMEFSRKGGHAALSGDGFSLPTVRRRELERKRVRRVKLSRT